MIEELKKLKREVGRMYLNCQEVFFLHETESPEYWKGAIDAFMAVLDEIKRLEEMTNHD